MNIINNVLQGNALDVLKKYPKHSIDLMITSPPYWGQRDYDVAATTEWITQSNCPHKWDITIFKQKGGRNINLPSVGADRTTQASRIRNEGVETKLCTFCKSWIGQLGHEPSAELFVFHLLLIFKELKRVMKPSGSIYVNIGDKYVDGVMQDIPFEFNRGMRKLGFKKLNTIIWYKTNGKPESIKNRFTNDFEYVFFYVLDLDKYYFDQQFEPKKDSTLERDKYDRGTNVKALHPESPNTPVRKGDKYKDLEQESSVRSGMHKARGTTMIKHREEPDKYKFHKYMNDMFSYIGDKKKLAERLELPYTTVEHWFRDPDKIGFSFPSIEDWLKYQKVYRTHKFPELVKYWEEPDVIKDSIEGGRNMRTVWSIPVAQFHGEHYAVFPDEIPLRIIKASCPKTGVVLDIFMGSGTTARAALLLGRNYSGIEINPEYIELMNKYTDNLKQTDAEDWLS